MLKCLTCGWLGIEGREEFNNQMDLSWAFVKHPTFIRSSLTRWPNKTSLDVRPYVCPHFFLPIFLIFGMWVDVDEGCKTVWPLTRLKVKVNVKVTPKLWNRPFSKSISSTVYDPSFEIPSDSDNMEQYINFVRPVFWNSSWFSSYVSSNLEKSSMWYGQKKIRIRGRGGSV